MVRLWEMDSLSEWRYCESDSVLLTEGVGPLRVGDRDNDELRLATTRRFLDGEWAEVALGVLERMEDDAEVGIVGSADVLAVREGVPPVRDRDIEEVGSDRDNMLEALDVPDGFRYVSDRDGEAVPGDAVEECDDKVPPEVEGLTVPRVLVIVSL